MSSTPHSVPFLLDEEIPSISFVKNWPESHGSMSLGAQNYFCEICACCDIPTEVFGLIFVKMWVIMFGGKLNLKKKFTVKEFCGGPIGTIFNSPKQVKIDEKKERIYVSDLGNSCISVFDKNNGNFIEKIHLNFTPDGFFVGKDGSLVIASFFLQKCTVVILDPISKSEKKIPLPIQEFKTFFCVGEFPDGILIANKVGLYILSNMNNSQKNEEIPSIEFEEEFQTEPESGSWKIRKIMNSPSAYKISSVSVHSKTLFGAVITGFAGLVFKFDFSGSSKVGENFHKKGLTLYRGIHVDSAGNILLTSRISRKIRVLSQKGEELSELPLSLHAPEGVTMDEDGNVFVSYLDKNVSAGILKLEPSS